MNSDSGSEEIVRNGTNRSVFHKKGMSFILRIHMIHVTYQMNFEFYFDPNPKIKITEGTSKISLRKYSAACETIFGNPRIRKVDRFWMEK